MKFTKLNIRGFSHHFLMMFVVLLVGVGGTFYLVLSHADTPNSSSTASSCFGNNCTATSGTSTNSTAQAAATAAPSGTLTCSSNTTDITLTYTYSNSPNGVYFYRDSDHLATDSTTNTVSTARSIPGKSSVSASVSSYTPGHTYIFEMKTRATNPVHIQSVSCALKAAPTSTSGSGTTTGGTGTTGSTGTTSTPPSTSTPSTALSGTLTCSSNTTDITLTYTYSNSPNGVYFYRDTNHFATDETANAVTTGRNIPGKSSLSASVNSYTPGHTYVFEMKTRATNPVHIQSVSCALKAAPTSTSGSGTTTGGTGTTDGSPDKNNTSDGLINCTFLDASGKPVTERHTPSWCDAKRAAQIAAGKLADTSSCTTVFGFASRFYADLKVCGTTTPGLCPTGTKVVALKSGSQIVYTCSKDTGSTTATAKCLFLDSKGKKVSETHTIAWCDAKHKQQNTDGHADKFVACKLLDASSGKLITEDHTVGYCTAIQAKQHISATGVKLELCKLTEADGTVLTPEYHNPGWCASRQKQIDAEKAKIAATTTSKPSTDPTPTKPQKTSVTCVWVTTSGIKQTTKVTSYTPNQDCHDKSNAARATKVNCAYSDGGHTQPAHDVTNAYTCATSYGGKSTKIVSTKPASGSTSSYTCKYLDTDGVTKTAKVPSAGVCSRDYASDAKVNRIYCVSSSGNTFTNTYNCIKNLGGKIGSAPKVSYCRYYDRHEGGYVVDQLSSTLTSAYCTGTLHGSVQVKST